MQEIISKELLSEVLGDEYIDRLVEIIKLEGNELNTYYDCGKGFPTGLGLSINIYELMHLMKKWAKDEGVTHFSSWLGDNECHSRFMLGFDFYEFDANTEPESVVKACQWILDKKDQNV